MYFYIYLSEFAHETYGWSNKDDFKPTVNDTSPLTAIMKIMLRTQAVAEIWPSDEFVRLIEAESLALELRTHRSFDSMISPKDIITKAFYIRDRDQRDNVTCYLSLVMPEVLQMANIFDTEMSITLLTNAIVEGQRYMLCPLGRIVVTEEMHLTKLKLQESINSASELLAVSLCVSEPLKNLLALSMVMLALRTAVFTLNWKEAENILSTRTAMVKQYNSLIGEEISRLQSEIENNSSRETLNFSLIEGKQTSVFGLVKHLSRHRRVSVSGGGGGGGGPDAALRKKASIDSSALKNITLLLDVAIEEALLIRNKSESITNMLRAAIIIRRLRADIAIGGEGVSYPLTRCINENRIKLLFY